MVNRDKLRGLMAVNKMTQAKLAECIGISTNALNKKLNGKAVFNEKEINAIAKCLGVTADFLFDN